MAVERLDVAMTSHAAVAGLLDYEQQHGGWEIVVQPARQGNLWVGRLERVAREPITQDVRPVAEQATALGLRRVADGIWSGTILEEPAP